MELFIKIKVIFISLVYFPLLIFQEEQREIYISNLVNLEKLLSLVIKQDKKYGYRLFL